MIHESPLHSAEALFNSPHSAGSSIAIAAPAEAVGFFLPSISGYGIIFSRGKEALFEVILLIQTPELLSLISVVTP
ncbi:hypothetical protein NG791_05970 [Laspinema sp. D1]|uniref:hypothetical protein n=1 Tax=Laspinema palackyanum TaxID=3231601 RepID=UPI00348D3A19|nr:hypothetical protein [Laspinema sp. D2b]